MVLAAIDIGSNAARLLISEAGAYKDGSVDFTKLNFVRIPLRLGFDVFELGVIGEVRKELFLKTMIAFKQLMDIYGVTSYRACATSAMRDAKNSADIMQLVKQETGIQIEIINGQEEGNIIYETHVAENLNSDKAYMYIDVGGGSTEVTLFSKDTVVFKESFNLGTIRLLQESVTNEQWSHMKWFIKQHTKDFQPIEAIGSGGNINKIFSLSKRSEGKPLTYEILKNYHKQLSGKTIEERIHTYGFREDRADVIVPALTLYMAAMRWAGANEIYVPKIGLADGIIKMLYRDAMKERD